MDSKCVPSNPGLLSARCSCPASNSISFTNAASVGRTGFFGPHSERERGATATLTALEFLVETRRYRIRALVQHHSEHAHVGCRDIFRRLQGRLTMCRVCLDH